MMINAGWYEHIRDEQTSRSAPDISGRPVRQSQLAACRAWQPSFRHSRWNHAYAPSEDVVLLEARRSMLVGEDAAVFECKCLNHRDSLFCERACTEERGQHTLLDGQGRP